MFYNTTPNENEIEVDPTIIEMDNEGNSHQLNAEQGDGGRNRDIVDQMESDDYSDEDTLDVDHESERDGEGNILPNEDDDEIEQLDVVVNTTTTETPAITMASGRTVNHPTWEDDYEMGLTAAEEKYYEAMKELQSQDLNEIFQIEFRLVGAGLGGIKNTNELKVILVTKNNVKNQSKKSMNKW